MSSTPASAERVRWIVLGRRGEGVVASLRNEQAAELERLELTDDDLPGWVGTFERAGAVRWVWNDTSRWYAALLATGVRVSRCHDLRLSHAILRGSEKTDHGAVGEGMPPGRWDAAPTPVQVDSEPALFGVDELRRADGEGLPEDLDEVLSEFLDQHDRMRASDAQNGLRLLLAAESAGALVAAELRAAGLPWDEAAHDRILTDLLGARSATGVPAKVEAAAGRVREALGDPAASLDSPPKLLRALHRVGVLVETTSRWELARHRHPVIEPLLEYKKLSRLLSANGWTWLDAWVHDGRFRPVYVPGGVVTGRWASSGGGALQLPRKLRSAVRADPGWTLIVADVAQLEPRVLAAIARDTALADAARGRDLYAGVVERGAVSTRAEAKVAMLGAMYGATTGDSGRLVPGLRRAFPRAMALVDDAAATGETGGTVSTWLGRRCPPPSEDWRRVQSRASQPDASETDQSRARRWARDRGRFTRNFVVQGTAAEWALAWMADLRGRLAEIAPIEPAAAAPRSGAAFSLRPHLAFFLHDEIIVHAPIACSERAADAVRAAAASAGRLLFGEFPIDFPLDLRVSEVADKE